MKPVSRAYCARHAPGTRPSATTAALSARLQRRRRGVAVKISTWQDRVGASFTLKHVLRKLALMFGDEGAFARSSDAGEACEKKMVADRVQDRFDACLLSVEYGNNHECRQDQHQQRGSLVSPAQVVSSEQSQRHDTD
jgi:hypothetical protein